MPCIRVLVVDDSAVVRRLLAEVLTGDPEIEIVGTASNGLHALERLPVVKPDLVTLDVEMPGMDGIRTLVEIRKRHPKLPVVMVSSLTEPGAAATLEALARGASDYVTKPTGLGKAQDAQLRVRADLLPKIKSLCAPRGAGPTIVESSTSRRRSPTPIEVVAIGTSTGGPNALSEIIPQIPANFPVPILVVQHMPPVFTRLLAERLDKSARVSVGEGQHGVVLKPGEVWLAPGDRHMIVAKKGNGITLALHSGPPENCCRPAVDVLFRSVAEVYGAGVLGLVMTGMGSDGTAGASAIRRAGGEVFAQDEASSVVWGMPGNAVAARQVDRICRLETMACEVIGRVHSSRQPTAARATLAP